MLCHHPATERLDRVEKFAIYKLLPSLREYLIVSQDRLEVELHRKSEDGEWTAHVVRGEDVIIELTSVNVELLTREIYAKLSWSQ